MLTTTIVAAVAAAISALIAWHSYRVSKRSAADAKRSADAAEESAEAAKQSARADAAADHRARTPRRELRLESKAGYRQGESDAVYEVVNNGPEHLESVRLQRPQSEDGVQYNVAATGRSEYGDEADLGPLPIASRSQFTLAVGPWIQGERLPVLRVRLVCTSDTGESWEVPFKLDPPRTPSARTKLPERLQ